ncbi:MAG: MFS transporter [candidate division KSB1 bacterium]|nr:MFS transporter [candidate division KSB1 bacterium]MDZ7318767.1 MFS transporter [candidate division KSB1 bacterium]MDZ7339856.1 MFS transporter [candidate division KSB1 bacterium]
MTVITTDDTNVNRSVALFVATLSSFFTPFMASSINIALPTIAAEFQMNAVLLSWIATSYLLAAAMFLVPFGKIADIYGRKKIFGYGMAIYTLASLLSAISQDSTQLLITRVLQGLGGSMLFGTAIAILTSVFPPSERGKVLGINVAAVYSGLSLGPFLGGFLTQHFGWRSIFLINFFLGLLVVIVVCWKLKGEWAEARGEKFDVIGSLIYSVMLVALMYGFSLLPKRSGGWLVLSGLVGIVAFIGWELRVADPILNIRLFRHNKVLTFSNLAALINYSATAAVAFLLSLYLQYLKGRRPQEAGLILVAQPIVMAIFSPLAGRLSDSIEPRIVASVGMALTVVGLVMLIFLNENTAILFLIGNLVLLGFGFAFFSSPNTNAVMSSVEKKFYGVASATLATMRLLGQMLSMGIAMLIFALVIGKVQITPDKYGVFLRSCQIAFSIFAVFCLAGIFASLARGRLRNGAELKR